MYVQTFAYWFLLGKVSCRENSVRASWNRDFLSWKLHPTVISTSFATYKHGNSNGFQREDFIFGLGMREDSLVVTTELWKDHVKCCFINKIIAWAEVEDETTFNLFRGIVVHTPRLRNLPTSPCERQFLRRIILALATWTDTPKLATWENSFSTKN